MRIRTLRCAGLAVAAVSLAACTTRSPQVETTPAALPAPEIPAKVRPSEIVGRWGYAAYHKPEDRARTEANARGQCRSVVDSTTAKPTSPSSRRNRRGPSVAPIG